MRIAAVHLPELNTTQFRWVKTTPRRHPQPVGPTYRPALAGEAIVRASQRPRREYFVGGSTVATIVGNGLAPRIRPLPRPHGRRRTAGRPPDRAG